MDATTQQIKDILNESADIEPEESSDTPDGSEVQESDDGATGSQPGAVDQQEPDEVASLEDDSEAEQEEVADGDGEPVEGLVPIDELLPDGVDPKDFYEGSGRKFGDNWVSWSEMADYYGEREAHQARVSELETSDQELRREALNTKQILDAMFRDMPSEELERRLARAQAYNSHYRAQQEELVLETIPEWKDATVRESDRQSIIAALQPWGFSEADIAATGDARTVGVMRDYAKMKASLEAAEAKVAEIMRTGGAKPGGKQLDGRKRTSANRLRQQQQAAKQSGDKLAQARAIDATLRASR